MNALFPLQLAVGDKFDVTFGTAADDKTPVTAITKNAESGAYTMTTLTKGVDGNYYIYLGSAKNGYIGPGADKFLNTFGDGKADIRVWDGGMGIGSATDITKKPRDFKESFLAGKTSDELKAGGTFSVDGYNWTVLAVDEYGNRLVMTDKSVTSMGARVGASTGNYPYNSTAWPARAVSFTNTLSSLKPYMQGVNIPSEMIYTASTLVTASDGLTTCTSSKTGATTFVPSASDINAYVYGNSEAAVKNKLYNGTIYGVRSQVKSSGGTIYGLAVFSSGDSFGDSAVGLGAAEPNYYDQYSSSSYAPRMAAWVRFSDADEVALDRGTTQDALDAWKNTGN